MFPSDTYTTASPEWHWLVILYFFFGGIAGGSYALAALIYLFGAPDDRRLRMVFRKIKAEYPGPPPWQRMRCRKPPRWPRKASPCSRSKVLAMTKRMRISLMVCRTTF